MVIVTTLFEWFKKIPWYVQAVIGLIVVPNMIINGIIVFFWGLPWQSQMVHGTIRTYEEKRDLQISRIQERQLLIDQTTSESIKRIEQHQGIMYQALISRHITP